MRDGPMSDSSPSNQPTGVGSYFTSSDAGSETGSASGPALQPESGWLAINGSNGLQDCIVGNAGAYVSNVFSCDLTPGGDPVYNPQYRIWVFGRGPEGAGSGKLELTFTDQGGSTYDLGLFSSDPAWHFLDYASESPGITEVAWRPAG